MTTVYLSTWNELVRALHQLGERVEQDAIRAMQDAARFGVAAVIRSSATTKPRPKASGTYENAWLVHRLRDGATVSNSARHAIFVERGRRPGRAPPLDPIKEWVRQKRLDRQALAAAKKRRKGTGKVTRKRTAARFLEMFVHMLARRIQRKIAARGVSGRYVLRRAMPTIAKRAHRELRTVVKQIVSNPPRGQG